MRNQVDFRTLGNDDLHEHDKSVHQSQAIELPNGKVLIALGQNPAARRLLIFDPGWLYETERHEDFRHGLGDLSSHLYVKSLTGNTRGWAGHCAWNRSLSAMLVREPDNPKASVRSSKSPASTKNASTRRQASSGISPLPAGASTKFNRRRRLPSLSATAGSTPAIPTPRTQPFAAPSTRLVGARA